MPRSLNFLYTCVRAAVNLHNQLLTHVLRLPKSWFDTNPAGQLGSGAGEGEGLLSTVLCCHP